MDALGEKVTPDVGLENRLKVENRLRQLEGKQKITASTYSKPQNQSKYEAPEDVSSFNPGADTTLETSKKEKKKKKKEDTDATEEDKESKKAKKEPKEKKDKQPKETKEKKEKPAKKEKPEKEEKKEKKTKKGTFHYSSLSVLSTLFVSPQ